jgi:hypothetical protein
LFLELEEEENENSEGKKEDEGTLRYFVLDV